MRVEIKHSEQSKGMISKTTFFRTEFNFIFSEEEKGIIAEADLGPYTFLEREPPFDSKDYGEPDKAYEYEVTLRKLLNDGGFHHASPSRRQAWDFTRNVKEQLPNLKAVLDKYAGIALENESIEL